jgi:hypothetical protein
MFGGLTEVPIIAYALPCTLGLSDVTPARAPSPKPRLQAQGRPPIPRRKPLEFNYTVYRMAEVLSLRVILFSLTHHTLLPPRFTSLAGIVAAPCFPAAVFQYISW